MPTPDVCPSGRRHTNTRKNNGTPQCAVEDVNHEGCADLVRQFVDTATWQEGTAPAVPTGNLKEEFSAVAREGADEIRVVR